MGSQHPDQTKWPEVRKDAWMKAAWRLFIIIFLFFLVLFFSFFFFVVLCVSFILVRSPPSHVYYAMQWL